MPQAQVITRGHQGKGRRIVRSPKCREWLQSIKDQLSALDPELLDVPLQVEIEVIKKRPSSYPAPDPQKPWTLYPIKKRFDVDNCAKVILDACTGLLWTDDGLVVELKVSKRWTDEDEEPGAIISVTPLTF